MLKIIFSLLVWVVKKEESHFNLISICFIIDEVEYFFHYLCRSFSFSFINIPTLDWDILSFLLIYRSSFCIKNFSPMALMFEFVSQFVNNSAMCIGYFSVMIYALGFQWLKIRDSTLRSAGLIPGQELGSHILCDIAKINNNNAKVI